MHLPPAQPPIWFTPELVLPPGARVVVLDDDTSIHLIWDQRFKAAFGDSVLHLSTPDELQEFAHANKAPALYLIDYELLGFTTNGLQLIGHLRIKESAVLVTSRAEELDVQNACLRLEVKLLPKNIAGFIPLRVAVPAIQYHAVLLDDDNLTHKSWTMTAKIKKKRIRTFLTPPDLLNRLGEIDTSTAIHIDFELNAEMSAEEVARELYQRGYQNLFLATGHRPEVLPLNPWVRDVVGKDFPDA